MPFNLVIVGEVLYAAELTLFMITGEGPGLKQNLKFKTVTTKSYLEEGDC